MERIIDLSLRHKDRLMAGLWLMKIIMLLKLKFFSLFFWSFQPFPAVVILNVHALCDWCMIASIFIYVCWGTFAGSSALAKKETPAHSELLPTPQWEARTTDQYKAVICTTHCWNKVHNVFVSVLNSLIVYEDGRPCIIHVSGWDMDQTKKSK